MKTNVKKDFKDDGVDAGEMVQVIAFAVCGVIFEDEEAESTLDDNYLKVAFRYKHPDGDESNLIESFVNESHEKETQSIDFIFQTAVLETCLLLRDSKYKGSSSYQAVITRLNNIEDKLDPYKLEFLELVKKLADYCNYIKTVLH